MSHVGATWAERANFPKNLSGNTFGFSQTPNKWVEN